MFKLISNGLIPRAGSFAVESAVALMLVLSISGVCPAAAATDLALGKAAAQSSNPFGGDPSRAVDGNTDGNWAHGSVTHTDRDLYAWWQVDLGAVGAIGSVDIWNRTDCCSERLSGFYVFVSDVPFASTDLTATLSQSGVSSYFVAGTAGSPTVDPGVAQRPLRARAAQPPGIPVDRRGAGMGRLSDVHADADAHRHRDLDLDLAALPESDATTAATATPGGVSDLALGKAATQSSNPFGGDPSRAVDGNTDGNWAHGSVTHTDRDLYAWWQVDLGAVGAIGSVDVWNRTDCCSERLSGFYVFVSDAPFASTDLTATLSQSGVSSYFVAGTAGSPTSIPVSRSGRYLRVQLNRQEYLSIAEVQVWSGAAAFTPTSTRTASAPPATATSTSSASPSATRTTTAAAPTATATASTTPAGSADLALGKAATQSSNPSAATRRAPSTATPTATGRTARSPTPTATSTPGGRSTSAPSAPSATSTSGTAPTAAPSGSAASTSSSRMCPSPPPTSPPPSTRAASPATSLPAPPAGRRPSRCRAAAATCACS